MAKKRKHSNVLKPSGPREVDPRDGKMIVNSYEDVADSEDEFHMQRDKVAFQEMPEAKRRRKIAEEDAFLDDSEEEILGYGEDSSDEGEIERGRETVGVDSNNEDDEQIEDEENMDGWVASREDRYGADEITTEGDAQMEEAEAKRIQQKQLAKMSDKDFGFDEAQWIDEQQGDGDDRVEEVLQDIKVTDEMGSKERLDLLRIRYPEFEFLADEFVRLQPLLKILQQDSTRANTDRVAVAKCRALTAYVASLSMYFAILTSPSEDGDDVSLAIDPLTLREHAVMESLLRCRELWTSVKDIKTTASQEDLMSLDDSEGIISKAVPTEPTTSTKLSKKARKQLAKDTAAAAHAQARRDRIAAAESDLASLSSLLPNATNTAVSRKLQSSVPPNSTFDPIDSESDFGEETHLSDKALAAKAAKKKSLRFYTSQIAQTSNRRADAGRDAGGDMDLPVKERLRDRQARLNAEAEARGKALDKYGRGTALGANDDKSGGEDDAAEAQKAKEVRDDEDDYYEMVAQTKNKKKTDKAEYTAAKAQADAEGAIVRVVEEVGEDGVKRAIGYKIEKNKGLAPKRSKLVRNPRVKKKLKYEEKMRKLNSMRATYKGGEERGGYVSITTFIVQGQLLIVNRVERRLVSNRIWSRASSSSSI